MDLNIEGEKLCIGINPHILMVAIVLVEIDRGGNVIDKDNFSCLSPQTFTICFFPHKNE